MVTGGLAVSVCTMADGFGVARPVEAVRRRVAGSVRSLISGGSGVSNIDIDAFTSPSGDPGLFGPGSVAWRVGADPAMLIGGVRALLLQTVHPLAMAGVAQHSNYRSDPWGRLQRTARYVSTTTFGSTPAAMAMVEKVSAVHSRVSGVAEDGRPYSALDPELLRWVHVTEVDSFVTAVRAFGRCSLTDDDVDRYHAEMSVLGELMGAEGVPASSQAVRDYYTTMAPSLLGSRSAREAVRFLLWPPVSARMRPAYLAVVSAAVSTLPSSVRQELWLPEVPLTERMLVGPSGRAMGGFLGWALGESPIVSAAHRRVM